MVRSKAAWLLGRPIRSDFAQVQSGWDETNSDKFWVGTGRLAGTVGMWAGAASMGMSRVSLLHEAPVSQLFRPSNWSREVFPPGTSFANAGFLVRTS